MSSNAGSPGSPLSSSLLSLTFSLSFFFLFREFSSIDSSVPSLYKSVPLLWASPFRSLCQCWMLSREGCELLRQRNKREACIFIFQYFLRQCTYINKNTHKGYIAIIVGLLETSILLVALKNGSFSEK